MFRGFFVGDENPTALPMLLTRLHRAGGLIIDSKQFMHRAVQSQSVNSWHLPNRNSCRFATCCRTPGRTILICSGKVVAPWLREYPPPVAAKQRPGLVARIQDRSRLPTVAVRSAHSCAPVCLLVRSTKLRTAASSRLVATVGQFRPLQEILQ